MSIVNQITSGVAVLVIMAVCTVLITDHIETKANTEHRVKSEESQEKILHMLKDIDKRQVRIEANQRFLINKYENDLNTPD